MIIVACEQNTPEWYAFRLGIPTASNFDEIVTADLKHSKSRSTYMYKLAGERITKQTTAGVTNYYMNKGHEREDESRFFYQITKGVEIFQPGFCYKDENKLYGASPDGLILDEKKVFETKNAEPHIQAARLDKGWSGSEYHRQTNGLLLVTGYDSCDLVSYCRDMKPVIVTFERDCKYLEDLEGEVLQFCHELDELVKRIS